MDGILQCCGGEGEWKDMLRWIDSNLWQNALEVTWMPEGRLPAVAGDGRMQSLQNERGRGKWGVFHKRPEL